MDLVGENHLVNNIPLHNAAASGSLDGVKYLLEQGEDPNCKDDQNLTALYYAISSGTLEIVHYLIECGAHVDQENISGDTPLHRAVEFGTLEMVKYLIKHGADVNHKNMYTITPLHRAAKSGSLELVKCLIQHSANVNQESIYRHTPLRKAVESGSLETVKYLIEHGADVNHKNIFSITPVGSDSFEILKYLIKRGADEYLSNSMLSTPLDLPTKKRSLEIVEYFIESNALETRGDSDNWNKILHLACVKGNSTVVEFLLEYKMIKDINNGFGTEWSPLRAACYHGHTAVVQILLKYNVDIRKEEKLECGNDEIISVLNTELKKSVKHREKIQLLKQMHQEKLIQVSFYLTLYNIDKFSDLKNFNIGEERKIYVHS